MVGKEHKYWFLLDLGAEKTTISIFSLPFSTRKSLPNFYSLMIIKMLRRVFSVYFWQLFFSELKLFSGSKLHLLLEPSATTGIWWTSLIWFPDTIFTCRKKTALPQHTTDYQELCLATLHNLFLLPYNSTYVEVSFFMSLSA